MLGGGKRFCRVATYDHMAHISACRHYAKVPFSQMPLRQIPFSQMQLRQIKLRNM